MKKLPRPLRTRFAGEILTEFLPPRRPSKKVIVIATGAPGYPYQRELLSYFSKKIFWVFLPRYRGTWESVGTFLKVSPHKDVLDVLDGLSKSFSDIATKKRHHVVPEEVYLLGGSFGGPAVLLAADDPRVTKVLAVSPVIDWNKLGPEEPLSDMHRIFRDGFGMGYRGHERDYNKLGRTTFYNPIDHMTSIPGEKVKIIQTKDDKVVLFPPAVRFAKATGATLQLVAHGGHGGVATVLEKRFEKEWQSWFRSRPHA